MDKNNRMKDFLNEIKKDKEEDNGSLFKSKSSSKRDKFKSIDYHVDRDDEKGTKEALESILGPFPDEYEWEHIYYVMKELRNSGTSLDKTLAKHLARHQFKKDIIASDMDEADGYVLFVVKEDEVIVKGAIGPNTALQVLKAVKEFERDIKKQINKDLS